MKKNIFLPIAAFILLISGKILAQDIHLIQYNQSPLNLNPAQTGMFDGSWRVAGNFRNQWSSIIPVPYNTYSASVDTKLSKLFPKSTSLPATAGLLVNSDKSGDSKLKSTEVYLSLGYIQKLTSDSTHLISFALQPGFVNKSFNTHGLTYDSQYDGTQYNSALSSNEIYPSTSINLFDFNFGAAYQWKKTSRKMLNAGFGIFHLNTPKETFYNTSNKLAIKTNFSAIAELPVAHNVGILPSFLYQSQGKFHETILGLAGKIYLTPANKVTTAISIGTYYRVKDAWALVANLYYKNFNVGVSYDINNSKLIAASSNKGAFEVSIIYILKKSTLPVSKQRVYPTYM